MFLICVVRVWIETVYFLSDKQALTVLLRLIDWNSMHNILLKRFVYKKASIIAFNTSFWLLSFEISQHTVTHINSKGYF